MVEFGFVVDIVDLVDSNEQNRLINFESIAVEVPAAMVDFEQADRCPDSLVVLNLNFAIEPKLAHESIEVGVVAAIVVLVVALVPY